MNQVGIKISGRIINNLRYTDDTTLMAESVEELKNLLKRVKEESEKAGLKLSIQDTTVQSHHFMANKWGNNGKSDRLYFLGLQKSLWMVTASMKLKGSCSLGERKSYDKPRHHIKKQTHYFANKGLSNQRYGFSSSHVWMWALDYKEGWMPKKWCFELWCWRRLLRVP